MKKELGIHVVRFPDLHSWQSGNLTRILLTQDLLNLPQMLGAFEFSLLKFDVGYPTGEKHKSFGTFALQSVGLPNLLAAEVNHFIDRLHLWNTF